MIKGLLNLPWFAWAAIALVIAIIYSFVWPHKVATANTGFRFLVLRWAHALTWFLLAINFLLRGFSSSFNGMANIIALTGAFIYILFFVMTFVVK
jgi:hypothetical protein